jgi:hypothetical protein
MNAMSAVYAVLPRLASWPIEDFNHERRERHLRRFSTFSLMAD